MINKPNILNRVLVAFVNFIILIIVTLAFDSLVTGHVVDGLQDYKTLKNDYEILEITYSNIQDEYHIFIYDENNNRIQNENLTEEDKQKFLNDLRVINIKEEASIISNKIRLYNIVSFYISYVLMSIVVYLLPALIFKKHQNIGMKSFNIVLMKHEEIPNRPKALLYLSIYVFFHVLLGIFTLFIINIIDIMYCNFDYKDHRTLLEKVFNYDFAIDEDKLEADTLSEEKIYELTHDQNNEYNNKRI